MHMKYLSWTVRALITAAILLMLPTGSLATTTLPTPPTETETVSTQILEGMQPSLVIIPKLSLAAAVESVGQTAGGAMDVPTDWQDVAWYEPGFAPGENGHAALAAHRDWAGNAGPFWDLKQLEAGDLIAVANRAGRVMIFQTESNIAYEKDADVSAQVFGQANTARLSLITCEGAFLSTEDTYSKRQVVDARLIFDSAAK